ncbi:hypothetical protein [Anabaena sp. UHCC 0204]|uniref:hypothetical protein n=1 Tax=Anabaena sp. UHCC 0204 TaxID=2590009 RepID=UPI0014474B6A|nr:hypothetical protein [Anabaena sp. UHCC 0204]MTJ10648.1 hypothetical protein [Anabaena sp. UHCC 0204]
MYKIQDNYRIKSHRSTDELTSHLSRICYWGIAVNIWKQCKSSPKFANSPQYPIPSPQSLVVTEPSRSVPNPQYREQRTNAAKFLIENKSLSPPLKTVAASSGVSQLTKKKLDSR